jgi:hypothetical protein
MTITKELLKNQIDKIDEKKLEEVFYIISYYLKKEKSATGKDLMANLRSISIDGPADFSQNLDLYLNGEKSLSHLSNPS